MSFGRGQRITSSHIFVFTVLVMSLAHFKYIFSSQHFSRRTFIVTILLICISVLFSYPALSHDFFSYIFDAKIATQYHANPYTTTPQHFSQDPDLRFMHWTHRTYPYGPTYLPITLIPSFLSFGKFILAWTNFKLLHIMMYLHAVWLLYRYHSPKHALLFATAPLLIIEGLVNMHNDFVGVWLGIAGCTYVLRGKTKMSFICMFASAGVKYITFPLLFIPLFMNMPWLTRRYDQKRLYMLASYIAFFGIGLLISYQWYTVELHAWYLVNLWAVAATIPSLSLYGFIFLTTSLLSYYPYVLGGEWGQGGDVQFKKNIQYVGLAITAIVSPIAILYQKFFRTGKNHSV
jgi:hypothetical protein